MSVSELILARPLAYRLWQAPFARAKVEPVLRRGSIARARRVLDIGCGPGTNARLFAHCDYLGVDSNERYIRYAARRFPGRFLCADACSLELAEEGSFDFVLSNSLLHHLDDEEVTRLLAALRARLTPDGAIHILDLVLPDAPGLARRLALSDRGDHPRPRPAWEALFAQHFEPLHLEAYPLSALGVPLWQMLYFSGRRRT